MKTKMSISTRSIIITAAALAPFLASLACGSVTETVAPQVPAHPSLAQTAQMPQPPISEPTATTAFEPTQSPLPTPTEPPAKRLSLETRDLNTWTDQLTGDINFLGIIVNTGGIDASLIKPVVTLRDAQHNVLASESADISFCSDTLAVGQSSPFWLRLSGVLAWTDYELTVQAQEAFPFQVPSYQGFDVVNAQGQPGQFGSYRIVGELKNTGGSDAEFVRIIVTLV